MPKTFADHLLKKAEIHAHLDLFVTDPDQKKELTELVEDIFTHHLLDTVLTHLPKHHHDTFTDMLKESLSDPKILKFLKEKIDLDIEAEISKVALKLKKDILADIKKCGKLYSI